MNLSLDEDRELLRKTLREFARARVRPNARPWDEAGEIPRAALDEGWALGFGVAGVPLRFGGAAEDKDATPSALTGAVALEELAWADLGYAQAVTAPLHAVVPIALYGHDGMRTEVLPVLCGEKLPAATGAWIEPHRTFDLFSLRARADAGSDGPALFGTKALVPGVRDAEFTVAYARARPAEGADAVQAFLVRGKVASGMVRGERDEVIGPRAVWHAPVVYQDCAAAPVGDRRGVDYARLAQRALVAQAAAALGVARAAAEYAADYAKQRVAFGRPIAQNQSIAFLIADAATDVEAARWMIWKAAWRIDRGEDALREAGLAFRFAADAAFRIADNGVQILGGHGVIRDHLAELFYRNARALGATPGWFVV